MVDLDWDDVQLFLRVVRAGSFNAAAEGTPQTQPTISRRIFALEQKLNTRLFRRLPRGVRLTPAGDAILCFALEMERAARFIVASAAQETELSGRVRLWVTDGIGGYWLPPRLAEFHKRFPAVTVDILCSQEPPNIDKMEADIVVHWVEPTHPDLVVLSKNTMVFRPCASRDYLEIYGVPQNLADLRRHRLCNHLHYPRDGEWKTWADLLDGHPNLSYRTNSSMTLGEATVHGVGISLQPIGVVDREPNVVMLDLEGYETSVTFWLVCHRETKDVPRMRALIEHLQSTLFQSQLQGTAFKKLPNSE
ncbi:LysR family transcriptional regulator [Azospirillum himalayense]|uniref:LysR family transcriptional regulator n=1 Tax=Azospirillum himalayense TaxID=654847 RepID=A0ABW0GF23_9PROT